ncbi:MAG: hypothetical protein ACRDJM_02240 [Actinomycetota bacterium]
MRGIGAVALFLAMLLGPVGAHAECDVVAVVTTHDLAQADPGSYRVSAVLNESTPVCADGSIGPATRTGEFRIVLLTGGFSCTRTAEPQFDPAFTGAIVKVADAECGGDITWSGTTSGALPEQPLLGLDPLEADVSVRRSMRTTGTVNIQGRTFSLATGGNGTFLLRGITVSD